MRRILGVALVLAAFGWAAPAQAGHNADLHSANMSLVANLPKPGTTNSDLAFWGNRLYAGNYGGFRIIDISTPTNPVVLSDFACAGSQNDVSVWENRLLFLSIDRDQDTETCENSNNTFQNAPGFEGIRIIDVSDPTNPQFVKAVPTDCGSHTNTLVPEPARNRVHIYVASYPLTGQDQDCNVQFKVSIITVPLNHPENVTVTETVPFTTTTAIGCHDVSVFMPLKLAAAACVSESEIWDISNPTNPVVRARIPNGQGNTMQISHAAAWSNDGKTVIFGDEAGGGAAPFCANPADTTGRMWFYNVTNPSAPAPLGSYKIPRAQGTQTCTAHNYNVLPLRGHDFLASAWYQGGTSMVNFDNPAAAFEVGFYDAQAGTSANTWSSYFYNGYVYTNDIARGVDVYAFNHPASQRALRLARLNPQTQEVLLP